MSKITKTKTKLIILDPMFQSGSCIVTRPVRYCFGGSYGAVYSDLSHNRWYFHFEDPGDRSEPSKTRLSLYAWERVDPAFYNCRPLNFYYGLLNLRTSFLNHPEYKKIKNFMMENLEIFDASGFKLQ